MQSVPYHVIDTALSRLRLRVRLLAAGRGALRSGAVLAVAGTAAAAVEAVFWAPPHVRVWIAAAVAATVLAVAVAWLVMPLVRRHTPEELALRLEDAHPPFRGLLITAVNLHRAPAHAALYSADITRAVVRRAADRAAGVPAGTGTDTATLRRTAARSLPAMVAAVLMFIVFNGTLGGAGVRLLHPRTPYARGPRITARVVPGDVTVVKGDSLTVRATFTPVPGERELLVRRKDRSVWERVPLAAVDSATFGAVVRDIRKDFSYAFAAPGLARHEYHVRVADRPAVRSLRWTLRPPRYTGLPVRTVTDNITQVETMAGSRVVLALAANKPLTAVTAAFGDSTHIAGKVDGSGATVSFRALRNRRFALHLTAADGIRTAEPVTYSVVVLRDDPPRISVVEPGTDVEAPESMVLPLRIRVWDDFGFSSLVLSCRAADREWNTVSVPLPDARGPERTVAYAWALEEAGLMPDETMAYYVTVYDNDAVSGPKSAVSRTFHVRNPSIFEMFDDIEREEDERIASLEEVARRGAAMREQLEEVRREMLNEKTVSWERRKELEGMIKKSERTAAQVEEAARSLDAMIEKMRQNDMAASETMEKLDRIRELMNEVATPEMREMMRKMNEAVENVSKRDIQDALKNFSFSHEKYMEKLDRTLDLLKKMKAERELDEAIRKADELTERQEQLNAEMDAASEDDETGRNRLADREERAAADADRLEKELKELAETLRETAPEAADAVRQAHDFMRQSRTGDAMRNAGQELRAGDMAQASQQGRKSGDDVAKTGDMLDAAKQRMQQQEKERMMRDLQAVTGDLLYLSHGQEELAGRTQALSRRSPRYPAVADEQRLVLDGMTRVTARLLSLARQSVFIPTEAGAEIGAAVSGMRDGIAALEARNNRQAAARQRQAVQALDQAAAVLRNVQEMMQRMSSMSQGSMMEQLRQMAQKQGGLNQMTQSLLEMMMGTGGGMGMQQRSQIARMAAEQQALQQQLSDMASQAGNMRNMLGRLGEMGKEMGEIAEDLKNGNVSERTLRRQERVLEQLLDTQRSVRRQDFSREREAAQGRDFKRRPPGTLPDEAAADDPWRDDMLRALQEKYPRDYQELIRAYFRRLAEERREGAQ